MDDVLGAIATLVVMYGIVALLEKYLDRDEFIPSYDVYSEDE